MLFEDLVYCLVYDVGYGLSEFFPGLECCLEDFGGCIGGQLEGGVP